MISWDWMSSGEFLGVIFTTLELRIENSGSSRCLPLKFFEISWEAQPDPDNSGTTSNLSNVNVTGALRFGRFSRCRGSGSRRSSPISHQKPLVDEGEDVDHKKRTQTTQRRGSRWVDGTAAQGSTD